MTRTYLTFAAIAAGLALAACTQETKTDATPAADTAAAPADTNVTVNPPDVNVTTPPAPAPDATTPPSSTTTKESTTTVPGVGSATTTTTTTTEKK